MSRRPDRVPEMIDDWLLGYLVEWHRTYPHLRDGVCVHEYFDDGLDVIHAHAVRTGKEHLPVEKSRKSLLGRFRRLEEAGLVRKTVTGNHGWSRLDGPPNRTTGFSITPLGRDRLEVPRTKETER